MTPPLSCKKLVFEECARYVRARSGLRTAGALTAGARIAASEAAGRRRRRAPREVPISICTAAAESVVGTRHGHYKQGTRAHGRRGKGVGWAGGPRTCSGNRINLLGGSGPLSFGARPPHPLQHHPTATRRASSFLATALLRRRALQRRRHTRGTSRDRSGVLFYQRGSSHRRCACRQCLTFLFFLLPMCTTFFARQRAAARQFCTTTRSRRHSMPRSLTRGLVISAQCIMFHADILV